MWPLTGIRVAELTHGIAGPLCGKLLADAGASVTRVSVIAGREAGYEPSDDWSRFLNRGKQVVNLDPTARSGRASLEELLAQADLFLTSATHDQAASLGLDCDSVLERHPALLAACVTPFGQSGPYASFQADDLALSALCGLADATPGFPDHQEREDDPPVQSLAPLAEMAGGLTASCAVVGALRPRLRGHPGPRHVEIASLEAAAGMMVFEWGTTAYGGGVHGRRPLHDLPEPNVYLPCADGQVVIVAFRDDHWQALVELMGSPPWTADPAFRDASARRQNRALLHEHLRSWTIAQRGRDLLVAAQERGLPCCPSFELSETLASEHLRELGSLLMAADAVLPADPVIVNGTRRGAPAVPQVTPACPQAPTDGGQVGRPLSGVQVLDLTHIVAGPFCGQLLAALGADVILVESATYPVSRGFGPFLGEPKHDTSMMFNHVNRGKRSVQIDLTTSAGRRLLRDLAASVDVVLENFSRRAAERLGVTYDELAGERDDLILATISGFGRSGPWGDYVALHSGVILLSGLASVTRDEFDRPRLVGSIYPDPLAGAYAALAVQQALASREQTGRGCHLEISMLDVLLACMGGLVPVAARGEQLGRHPGCFLPTAERAGFLAVPASAVAPRPDLPARIAAMTRAEAMHMLQGEGIAAAAVLDMAEVMSDPHLAERGFITVDDHPLAAGHPVPAVPWLYDGVREPLGHAPCLGDATEQTLTDLAGLTLEQVQALQTEGALT